MRPDLVIFDCDGVLVDSERATNEGLVENLAHYGFQTTVEDAFRLFVGGTMAGLRDKVIENGVDLPDDWLDEIYAQMFARLKAGVPPVPGVIDVLDRLDRAGIPYGVGSNGPPEKMDITLGQNNMIARFGGHIYSAHTVGIAKPDPGLFLHVAAQFDAAPDRTVVIEDSATGVRAATAAGMRCYGYAGDTPAEKLRAVGAIPFFDMTDLPGFLNI